MVAISNANVNCLREASFRAWILLRELKHAQTRESSLKVLNPVVYYTSKDLYLRYYMERLNVTRVVAFGFRSVFVAIGLTSITN